MSGFGNSNVTPFWGEAGVVRVLKILTVVALPYDAPKTWREGIGYYGILLQPSILRPPYLSSPPTRAIPRSL